LKSLNDFIKSTVIGGLLVVLPMAIFLFIVSWVFGLVHGAISPLTTIVIEKSTFQGLVADVLVIAFLVLMCFSIGVLIRTRLGKWLHDVLEARLFLSVPGYSLIKETVLQFLGNKKSPFSSVALVQIYGNQTLVSAFITDEHENGTCTVFVPTGPNPTSGNIYHIPREFVHPVDVSVEVAMRSIIGCGAGSSPLIRNRKEHAQEGLGG